jgi:predicted transcriptional regulator
VQTTVYRLEVKKALRRVKKIATALIFEAAISREAAERTLINALLALLGGRSRPIMAHLVESGNLTIDDIREAEKVLLTRDREDEEERPK